MKTSIALALTVAYASADMASTVLSYGVNAQDLNTGMMSAMQTDMSATDTDCYDATVVTNLSLATFTDATAYTNESFN